MAAASRPEQPAEDQQRDSCGAKTRAGSACKKRAGFGTDHVGFGNCNNHGGASPNGAKHAARLMAAAEVSKLGSELDIDPHEGLLWLWRRAAGAVLFWTWTVEQLGGDELLISDSRVREWAVEDGLRRETLSSTTATLHIAVQALAATEERAARFAKMAIDAGVAERHVRVAERYGEVIARLLERVLGELRLTPEQQLAAPDVVRRNLQLLEGGASPKELAA